MLFSLPHKCRDFSSKQHPNCRRIYKSANQRLQELPRTTPVHHQFAVGKNAEDQELSDSNWKQTDREYIRIPSVMDVLAEKEVSKWKYHIVSNWLAPKILTYRSKASSPRALTKPLVSICPSLSTYSGRPSEQQGQSHQHNIFTVRNTRARQLYAKNPNGNEPCSVLTLLYKWKEEYLE